MVDLWAELNRRRNGEDRRITIERQHESHRNIEGHNLEGEFNSLAPAQGASAARAVHPPSSLEFQEGALRSLHTSV
jgi:hypothetical protein